MGENPWSSLKSNTVGDDDQEPSTEDLLRNYIDQKKQTSAPSSSRPVNRGPANLVDEDGNEIPDYHNRSNLDRLAGALAARNGIKDPANLRSVGEQEAVDYGMSPWDVPKIVTLPQNQMNNMLDLGPDLRATGYYASKPDLKREPPMASEHSPSGFIFLSQHKGPGATWDEYNDFHHEMSHANYYNNPDFERLRSSDNGSGALVPRWGDPTHSGGFTTVDPTKFGMSHGVDDNMTSDLLDELNRGGSSLPRLLRSQRSVSY